MRLLRRASVLAATTLLGVTGVGIAPIAHAASGVEGVPSLHHVFIVVLENENFNATWGSGSPAVYLNSLKQFGTLATNYWGTSHVSADNYIAMTSGQTPTPLFNADCLNWETCFATEQVLGGTSIADQVDASGRSWKAYMDGAATPCQHPAATAVTDPYQTGYATRHDPFVYYPPVVDHGAPATTLLSTADSAYCKTHVVPYRQSALAADLSSTSAPNYVFITPDTCHDGHDNPCAVPGDGPLGGLRGADAWLQANIPTILTSAAFKDRGVLLITSDEGAVDATTLSGCCATGIPPVGLDSGGKVGLLAISDSTALESAIGGGSTIATPIVNVGQATGTAYDHYSMLRTVEDALGLRGQGYLNNAGSPLEHPMASLFNPAA
jgi:hypothetical protein